MTNRSRLAGMRLGSLWFGLSAAAAVLAAAGNVVALAAVETVYGRETIALADVSIAQDLVNLVLVAPLLVTLGWLASRGSLPAYLGWCGCVAFLVYNYAIYAFSVHFGPLFLVWVAVLGLSTFALAGGLTTLDSHGVRSRFRVAPVPAPAWCLIVVAVVFAALWLKEIVPDLIAGDGSRSASDWRIPTNPVHVLDLALFLPATLAAGILLLRRHRLGYATAPGLLVWAALTCVPILVSPIVADARGHEASWAVMVPIGVILVSVVLAATRLLRRLDTGGPDDIPTEEPERSRRASVPA